MQTSIKGGRRKSRRQVQQSTSTFMRDQHGPGGATESFCVAHILFPEDDGETSDGSKCFSSRPPAMFMKGWAASYCLAIWAGHSDIKKNPIVHFSFSGTWLLHFRTGVGLSSTLTLHKLWHFREHSRKMCEPSPTQKCFVAAHRATIRPLPSDSL